MIAKRAPDVTFIIPVAPYHEALLERAIASINAQTVPCEYIIVHDTERRGAGAARNVGLKQVNTPLLSFLDADDWLEPTFVEECLHAYEGTQYIYTDWYGWLFDDALQDYIPDIKLAPECVWNGDGSAHIITTLLPTHWVRRIDGFDETLPGFEDTAFYWKLTRSGLCGKRLASPLFHYGREGRRAEAFKNNPKRQEIAQQIMLLYRGQPMSDCGGCGGSPYVTPEVELLPIGEQQAGDVLAQALWVGNLQERGRITGRLYPRTSRNGNPVWVAPRDIEQSPHRWTQISGLPSGRPSEDDFRFFAPQAMAKLVGKPPRTPQPTTPLPMPSVTSPRGDEAASAGQVLRLYGQQHT